ncbi:MAG: hypothetical protein SF187_13995 [Deltaproteobacteria bacterium]|nr:hypothetical protein [Deltaproteobacteria bacterium]
MPTLNEILTRPGIRPQVVKDAERVVEEEVDSKGLTGLPIKAAYKIVKTVKPGFVPEVLDHLVEDFAKALDPLYQEAVVAKMPLDAYLASRSSQAAEALLAITDGRAGNAKNQMVKSTYEKLRPTAKKHVEAAIPRVSRMVAKHANNG